jgi:large subunit ribosomal protein L35
MPKMKSNRAAHKRFKKTATGRVKRNTAYHRHLLTGKSRKRKRQLRGSAMVDPSDARRMKRLLPD